MAPSLWLTSHPRRAEQVYDEFHAARSACSSGSIPKASIMDAKTDLGTLREQHLERVYGLFEGKAKKPR